MQDQGPDVPGDRGHLPEEDMKVYVYATSPESTPVFYKLKVLLDLPP